jgi:AmmeMemoRadiSam system protein B/AmmeMemoRadiSam system protein A
LPHPDCGGMAMKQRLAILILLLSLAGCGTTPQAKVLDSTAAETGRAQGLPTATAVAVSPTPQPRDVHGAEGAGKWYPADPLKLEAAVSTYVSQPEVDPIAGRLLAVIVPHAGYIYSGIVAGYAFRVLQEAGCSQHTLVVIGDTHSGSGSAEIAVWAAGVFETPLGALPIDEEVAQAMVDSDPRIEFDRRAFRAEHPVENQLPFIQVACPGARIVPVVIRQPSLQNAQILADAVVRALGERRAYIVASTDLSHYHSYEEANQMDEIALQAIVSLDPQAVVDSSRRCAELGLGSGDPVTMCSQGAVMTAIIAAQQMGADRGTVLRRATSGDVPVGDRTAVVGYGAVALWQSQAEQRLPNSESPAFATQDPLQNAQGPIPLSSEAQQELLALARDTLAHFLETETFPPFHTDDPALLQPMGAYVTYEVADSGMLRGCLGRLEGDRSAYLNVQYAAVAAALADSRFPAVTLEELETLTLEITLLEPMQLVTNPQEILIGRDGVLMQLGERQGALFLPQVPLEEGWDREELLVNLCRKAGLPDDAWQRSDARFYVFAGQWFGEED